MAFAVELTLDRAAGSPVRALWERMADAGIRFMSDSGAEPHVTLGVWETMDVGRCIPEIVALAAATAPVPLTFIEVRTFGANVVYLAPTPSARLVDLHQWVQARVGALAVGEWPHYARDVWVPHCTLAMELGSSVIETALGLATTMTLPLTGYGDRVAIVEFRPVRERYSYPLTG